MVWGIAHHRRPPCRYDRRPRTGRSRTGRPRPGLSCTRRPRPGRPCAGCPVSGRYRQPCSRPAVMPAAKRRKYGRSSIGSRSTVRLGTTLTRDIRAPKQWSWCRLSTLPRPNANRECASPPPSPGSVRPRRLRLGGVRPAAFGAAAFGSAVFGRRRSARPRSARQRSADGIRPQATPGRMPGSGDPATAGYTEPAHAGSAAPPPVAVSWS